MTLLGVLTGVFSREDIFNWFKIASLDKFLLTWVVLRPPLLKFSKLASGGLVAFLFSASATTFAPSFESWLLKFGTKFKIEKTEAAHRPSDCFF